MCEKQILDLAREAGFFPALCDTADIPVEYAFRRYCEENLCGQYGKNYGCPPHCGTPEEMEHRLRVPGRALVLQSEWPISDYTDRAAITAAKVAHNAASFALLQRLAADGVRGFMVGCSGCTLCEECALFRGEPCAYPDQRYACMSAYCVHVLDLATRCGLRYDCDDGKLRMFGMLVLGK